MRTLALALALAVALLAPAVAAAPTATVSLAPTSDPSTWNGRSEATAENGSALVWVPANARVHAVSAVMSDGSTAPVSWRAQGDVALMVDAPNMTSARVEFDFRAPSALALARIVAPGPWDRLTLDVMAPDGLAVDSKDASFTYAGQTDWQAEVAPLAAGQGITIRVVDADRVGELPLLAALVIVGTLALLLTLVWHQLRPPAPKDDAAPVKFLDHLLELQARLMPPVLWFAFLNVFYFVAGLRVVRWRDVPFVVPTLSTSGSLAARAFDAFAARQVPDGVTLVVLRPIDAVLAEVQVALFLAFVTVLPLLLYELVAFIGPALRDRERSLALRTIPLILLLFLVGAWFGYVTMSPLMIRTLYDFAPDVGATSFLAVGDLVSFALIVVLSFGAAFELPVLMYALSRFGVVQAKTWRKYVRHAILAIFIVAGLITPDPSLVSQTLVAVPVTVLYLLGMLAASWAERKRTRAQEAAALPA